MDKKGNKKVLGIEKVEKKNVNFRKELETYLVFGLVILFVGIFIGTTASAIYNSKNENPVDLDSTKMIEPATPEDEVEEITTDELDLNEIEQVQGATEEVTDEYQPIYPE